MVVNAQQHPLITSDGDIRPHFTTDTGTIASKVLDMSLGGKGRGKGGRGGKNVTSMRAKSSRTQPDIDLGNVFMALHKSTCSQQHSLSPSLMSSQRK